MSIHFNPKSTNRTWTQSIWEKQIKFVTHLAMTWLNKTQFNLTKCKIYSSATQQCVLWIDANLQVISVCQWQNSCCAKRHATPLLMQAIRGSLISSSFLHTPDMSNFYRDFSPLKPFLPSNRGKRKAAISCNPEASGLWGISLPWCGYLLCPVPKKRFKSLTDGKQTATQCGKRVTMRIASDILEVSREKRQERMYITKELVERWNSAHRLDGAKHFQTTVPLQLVEPCAWRVRRREKLSEIKGAHGNHQEGELRIAMWMKNVKGKEVRIHLSPVELCV